MTRSVLPRVLEDWTERDLTAAARAGELQPAFAIDDKVALAGDILAAGRGLAVVGEPGVGKTTLVHELVRRAVAGDGPRVFDGRRVLQFSLRHRATTMKNPKQLGAELQNLVDLLCQGDTAVLPFFRDLHLTYTFDLEPQIQALAQRIGMPILAEAEPALLSTLFEDRPELEQHFVTLTLEEPDIDRATAIVRAWAGYRHGQGLARFSEAAQDEAVHLSHRFLSRNRFPRKAVDLLLQSSGMAGSKKEIDRNAVIAHFAAAYRVPRTLVDPAEPLDVTGLERTLARELLGQHEAVEAITRIVSLIKSGMSDTRRPFGVFLFAGPTGVGKTHAAKLLAEHLFGSGDRVIRLNMADFDAAEAADVLFGNPVAYQLPLRRGLITQRTAGQPFALLLLDEFEKAHEKVADRFLQLFDEGKFINGLGETIGCRSTIIIATSNVGAELYRQQPPGFFSPAHASQMLHDIDRRLTQRFRFELLNRFDQIVHFAPLSRADVRQIAARELQALERRVGFKRTGMVLEVDESVLDWLAAHGYDPQFGARFLRRTLERHVTSALADLLVRGPLPSGAHARLRVRANRIEGALVQAEPAAKGRREAVTLPRGAGAQTRTLDRAALMAKASQLLGAYAQLRPSLEAQQARATALLDVMNAPDFWERSAQSRDVLDEYRRVDVAVQMERRFETALSDLEGLVQGQVSPDVARLARAVEQAARALRDWQDGRLDDGVRDVWVVLERLDGAAAGEAWLLDVAAMEQAWCRRLHLETAVVACELKDEALVGLVLHVEGPGARMRLAAEEGVHRRTQDGRDVRVRVRLVPRGSPAGPSSAPIVPLKKRRGPLGMAIACRVRLEDRQTGGRIELAGDDGESLRQVLVDLVGAPDADRLGLARVYGKDGVGARDPRTGAIVVRLKDVMRGELDPFLDAWQTRVENSPSGSDAPISPPGLGALA